jgi:hypothetical protein
MSGVFSGGCPQGSLITGLTLRSGASIDQIAGIYCKSPSRIADSSYNGDLVAINGGGNGGSPSVAMCPAGSGVAKVVTTSDGNIRSIQFTCRQLSDLTTASQSTAGDVINSGITNSDCGGNNFVTGVSGTYSGVVTSTNWNCGDFTAARQGLYTDGGKANCCMGLFTPSDCPMTGQTAQCDAFMSTWCRSNPSDPRCSCVASEMTCPNKFDKGCIANNGYKTSDMVNAPCPNIMNCTQFLSLSPGAQAVATNVDQNCSSGAATQATQAAPTGSSGGVTAFMAILLVVFFIMIVVIAVLSYNFVQELIFE